MQRHVAGNRDRAGPREREKRGELLVGFFGCAAVGAVTADLGASQKDLKAKVSGTVDGDVLKVAAIELQ